MEERKMKKELKSMVLVCLLALFSLTAKAQIYIMDDEEAAWSNREGKGINEVPIPPQDMENDWIEPTEYVPLCEGWLLLVAMGSVYMLGKGRKKRDCK